MKRVFFGVLTVLCLCLAGYGLWHLVPQSGAGHLGPLFQPLLREAAHRAVASLRREKMPEAVFIAPVRGDVREQVRKTLREEIEAQGLSRVVKEARLGEKLGGSGFVGTLLKELLGSDPELPLSVKRAREFLQKANLPGVLLAEAAIEENEEEASVSLTLQVIGASGSRVAASQSRCFCAKTLFSWPYVRSRVLRLSFGLRLLLWAGFVFVLPLASSPLIIRGLRRESNCVNACMLLCLTAVSALFLWFLLGFSTANLAALCVGVLGCGLAGVYHYLVVDFFEELTH